MANAPLLFLSNYLQFTCYFGFYYVEILLAQLTYLFWYVVLGLLGVLKLAKLTLDLQLFFMQPLGRVGGAANMITCYFANLLFL